MINKKYLNISEVSKLLQIEEHKIRYWDSIDPKTNKYRIDGISTKRDDREEYAAAVKYTYGPLSVGYQKTLVNNSFKDAEAGGVAWVKGSMYGISYSVNDNLAISYQENESQQKTSQGASSGASTKQKSDGVSISYSIGGMSLAYVDNSFDNSSYTVDSNKDYKQVVLGVAF